jgi:hypothetical protein
VGWAFSCGDVVIPRPRAPESAGKNWVRIKHINMICYKRLAVNRAAAREVFARTAGCVLQELCASGAANGFRGMWADQNRRQGFCPAGLYARGAMPRGAMRLHAPAWAAVQGAMAVGRTHRCGEHCQVIRQGAMAVGRTAGMRAAGGCRRKKSAGPRPDAMCASLCAGAIRRPGSSGVRP